MRRTYMVREHHVAILSANHVSVFYIGSTTNIQFYGKCTYIIGREHNHVMLPNHTSIFPRIYTCQIMTRLWLVWITTFLIPCVALILGSIIRRDWLIPLHYYFNLFIFLWDMSLYPIYAFYKRNLESPTLSPVSITSFSVWSL